MSPFDAMLDLMFLLPIAMGAGLVYLWVSAWLADRRHGAVATPSRSAPRAAAPATEARKEPEAKPRAKSDEEFDEGDFFR